MAKAKYSTSWKSDEQHEPLFHELVSILGDVLPGDEATRLVDDPSALSDHLWVQIAPAPLVWQHENAISAVLDQASERSDLAYRVCQVNSGARVIG